MLSRGGCSNKPKEDGERESDGENEVSGGKFAVMIKVTLSAASSTTMLDSVSGTLPSFVAIGDRTGEEPITLQRLL